MENENKKAYSEVIEILKTIDSEKRLEALPMEMLELLKSKADPGYKPEISTEIPLDEQNLQPETISILSWIALKYWSDELNKEDDNIIEKKELKDIPEQNEKQDDWENIVEENDNQEKNENVLEENKEQESIEKTDIIDKNNDILPMLYKDYKWFQKIKIKIMEFFKRFFGKNKASKLITEEKGNDL